MESDNKKLIDNVLKVKYELKASRIMYVALLTDWVYSGHVKPMMVTPRGKLSEELKNQKSYFS